MILCYNKKMKIVKKVCFGLMFLMLAGCEKKINSADFIAENNGNQIVFLAVQTNNIKLLQDVINEGFDVNESVRTVQPLMWACRTGNLEQIKILLDAGADVNALSSEGMTPLDYACLSESGEAVKLLIAAGGDPDHVTEEGNMTPLISATVLENTDIVKALVENGAKVNWQDDNGDTALMYAVYNFSYKSAKILIDAGADPYLANREGYTPAESADEKMKKIFLKK